MPELKLAKAEREYDLEKAAELRHGTIPGIEKQIAAAEKKLKTDEASEHRLLKEEVDEEDIAEIVAAGPAFP